MQALTVAHIADEEREPQIHKLNSHLVLLELIAAEYDQSARVMLLKNDLDELVAEGSGAGTRMVLSSRLIHILRSA
jgi:hypothetical protein